MSIIQLDPWPLQPYAHGAQSAGSTGYVIPAIPGAQAVSLWLQLTAASSGYIFDARPAVGGYWVYNENGANGSAAIFRGAPISSFGFNDLQAGLGKLYFESTAEAGLAAGLHLLARYDSGEFAPAHKAAQIRVHSRRWTAAEKADPRGNGPTDALLAVYDLADLSGGILRDVSGNNRNGTVAGAAPALF